MQPDHHLSLKEVADTPRLEPIRIAVIPACSSNLEESFLNLMELKHLMGPQRSILTGIIEEIMSGLYSRIPD